MEGRIIFVYVMMTVLAVGLLVCYLYMGGKLGNQDVNNELAKHLQVIGGITAACTVVWIVLTYFYFMANTEHVIPYLLISQGFTMFISLFALAAAGIQLTTIS